MTVKEFYKWAVEHGCEDVEIAIQHRDGGGYYCGYDDLYERDIEYNEGEQRVEI